MTNEALPDYYLSIPVFREHARGAEIDALFEALFDSMIKLMILLRVHHYSDVSIDRMFEEVLDSPFDCSQNRLAVFDHDLAGLDEDTSIHFLNDQVEAMLAHCQLIFDYGFPDMVAAGLEYKLLQCQRLASWFHVMVKNVDRRIYPVPRAWINLYFRWQFHRESILNYAHLLSRAAKPYVELDRDNRYARLKGMLSLTDLSTDMSALENDQDRLRVVSQLLFDDAVLPSAHRQRIGSCLIYQVEKSTMLKLMSQNEFSSLLLLLLSDSILPRVKQDTQLLLSKRLRGFGLPIDTKIDYYHSFVEAIMAHSNCVCLESVLLMMNHEIDHDINFLFKSHSRRDALEPIRLTLECLYEYSLYLALCGEARMGVCEKLLNRIDAILLTSVTRSFLLILAKLRLLLKLDFGLQKHVQHESTARYRFFSVTKKHADFDASLYDRCKSLIWQTPSDTAFCQQCVDWVDDACLQTMHPDAYLAQFIDCYHRGSYSELSLACYD